MFLTAFSKGGEGTKLQERPSQSPQIGSMFLTQVVAAGEDRTATGRRGRNPLKSGQCFLLIHDGTGNQFFHSHGRNPLKSGQCFLLKERGK